MPLNPRARQIAFVVVLLVCCWLGMTAVHEFGHVVGAWFTGGVIVQVNLNPLSISQTDVSPNPNPLVVVWLGPIVGCLLPMTILVIAALLHKESVVIRKSVEFFVGFCLIANGGYIGLGGFERIGDCRTMLDAGTPLWVMIAFGVIAIGVGLMIWHRMGALADFIQQPGLIKSRLLLVVLLIFFVLVTNGLLITLFS